MHPRHSNLDDRPRAVSLRSFYVNSPFERRDHSSTRRLPPATTCSTSGTRAMIHVPRMQGSNSSTPNLSLKAILPKWRPAESIPIAINKNNNNSQGSFNSADHSDGTARYGSLSLHVSPNTALLRSIFQGTAAAAAPFSLPQQITTNQPPLRKAIKSQYLSVYVISCHGIVAADSNGKSDPYVEITFSGKTLKTSTVQDTTNPTFDEYLDFQRRPRAMTSFTLQVFDEDDFGEPDLLGTVVVDFNTFELHSPQKSKYIFGNDSRRYVSKEYDLELPPEFVLSSTKLSSTVTILWSHEIPAAKEESEMLMPEVKSQRSRSNTHESFTSLTPRLTNSSSSFPSSSTTSTSTTSTSTSTTTPFMWINDVLKLNQATRILRLTDNMYNMESWDELHVKCSPGVRADDRVLLRELGRPSHSLVVVLISAELRLRSHGLYARKKPLQVDEIAHILDAGHALEKMCENLLLYMLEKWEKLPATVSTAKLKPSSGSGIQFGSTFLLAILAAIPFGTFLPRERLLKMLLKSSIDEDAMDVALVCVHGVLCQNSNGEYGICNITFWNVLRRKFHYIIGPSRKIQLTEGIEAEETKLLTEAAWCLDPTTAPLVMSIETCHIPGTVYVTDVPLYWWRDITKNKEKDVTEMIELETETKAGQPAMFYANLIQIVALTTSKASALRSSKFHGSNGKQTTTEHNKSIVATVRAFEYSRKLLLSLRRDILQYLRRPTLVRFSLIGASHLPIMDAVLRSSDPYAIISLNGHSTIFTTPTRSRTLRPKWDDVVLCMTSWQKTDVIEICMYDRDSSFGANEGNFVASEDSEDDEIGRLSFNISTTSNGEHTSRLILPKDVKPSSSEHHPSVTYTVERIDLLPSLTLLDRRLERSLEFLLSKEDMSKAEAISGNQNQKDQQEKKTEPGQMQYQKIMLETVEAARSRLTDLKKKPAKTLQDICSIICMLDNQTLADLSGIFHSRPTNQTQLDNTNALDTVSNKMKKEALRQLSPKREKGGGGGESEGRIKTSEGWTTHRAFRKGIVNALVQCGFEPPTSDSLDELLASLDEEQRGVIKFSKLSGILIGSSDNELAANTKYRGIPMLPHGLLLSTRQSSTHRTIPLEGTQIPGLPEDAITSMCVIRPARGSLTSKQEDNFTRICTLSAIGKYVAIVDVGGSPKSTMHARLVANVSMQTPDRIACCCTCGDTGLLGVSTEGNDLLFFIGSSNWNQNINQKKTEVFKIRYKITNLSYSPCAMNFFSGELLSPHMASRFSTRDKDMMLFGGEKGEVSLFVFSPRFRNEAIKFTSATERWPPAYRVLLREEIHCTIVPDKIAGSASVTGGERSTISSTSKLEHLDISETGKFFHEEPIPNAKMNILHFSFVPYTIYFSLFVSFISSYIRFASSLASLIRAGSWRCKKLHKLRITAIEYHVGMSVLVTSSEDGTIKLTEVIYYGSVLHANESVQLGDTRTFEGHEGKPVNGFVFSGPRSIFSYGMARDILEWDLDSQKVLRKFYVGCSVRDAQILNGVSSQHLIVLTVPRITTPDNDTLQTQWIRVFDVIGGAEIQNFSKEYSSYIRGGSGTASTAPHRETTSLLTRSSTFHNGLSITASRSGLSCFAVPPVWNPVGSLQLDGSLVVPVPGYRPIVTHEHTHLVTVLMSPLFDFVATVDDDGLCRLWDLNSGTHANAWTIPMEKSVAIKVSTASMDMSGQYVLIGFTDSTVKIVHVFR